MRSAEEIQAEFDVAVKQRERAPKGSAARRELNLMIRTLAWVIEHPDVPEIRWSDEQVEMLGVVG